MKYFYLESNLTHCNSTLSVRFLTRVVWFLYLLHVIYHTLIISASDPPTGLTGVRVITDEGTYAIRITWTPPLDPPTTIYGYRICYHNGTLPVETVVVRGGSVTSYDLAVNPLAHYNIKMQTLFTAKLPSGISVALHSEGNCLR